MKQGEQRSTSEEVRCGVGLQMSAFHMLSEDIMQSQSNVLSGDFMWTTSDLPLNLGLGLSPDSNVVPGLPVVVQVHNHYVVGTQVHPISLTNCSAHQLARFFPLLSTISTSTSYSASNAARSSPHVQNDNAKEPVAFTWHCIKRAVLKVQYISINHLIRSCFDSTC